MHKISTPLKVLNEVFGYDQFRPSQEEVINAVVDGRDGLVVLTTGGGKSLCFQIPALCFEGTTVVISPLISLMKDQVDALTRKGVKAAQLNSSMTDAESDQVKEDLAAGRLKMLYISPERLAEKDFLNLLKNVNISFFAVDEAHCISTWGRDFRLSYSRISHSLNELEQAKGVRIPRFAYTATATPAIREDIQKQLEMQDPFLQVGEFDRPNIEFNVKSSNNKLNDIIEILNSERGAPTIIYTATVKAGEELTNVLLKLGANVGLYHGRLTPEEKQQHQEDFLNDKINVMVATNAFGMGVDKPNVRHVIHYHMPGNLEGYFQEAGRAGRDGEQSRATMLYSDRDRGLQEFFIRNSFPDVDAIRFVIENLQSYEGLTTLNINSELLAEQSEGRLRDNQLESVLRVLDDQGLISYKGIEGTRSDFSVQINNLEKELNLDLMAERKKNVMDNLNTMDRYCKTNLCRRRYIIRYFGSKQEHKNCGTCDICIGINNEKQKLTSLIEKSDVKTILKTILDTEEKYDARRLIDILIGVNSTAMQRRGHTELEGFGVLKNASKSEAEAIMVKLHEEGYILISKMEPDVIKLTSKARKQLEENAVTMTNKMLRSDRNIGEPAKSNSDKTIKAEIIDVELYEKISKARQFFASEKGVPAATIYSDASMKIMASNPPRTTKDLEDAGLPPGKVKDFGGRLLKLVDNHLRIQQPLEI
ncbi:ATP-dependent DNA helicase RecQ [compost metagenome]